MKLTFPKLANKDPTTSVTTPLNSSVAKALPVPDLDTKERLDTVTRTPSTWGINPMFFKMDFDMSDTSAVPRLARPPPPMLTRSSNLDTDMVSTNNNPDVFVSSKSSGFIVKACRYNSSSVKDTVEEEQDDEEEEEEEDDDEEDATSPLPGIWIPR
jgi:hypothetical protein